MLLCNTGALGEAGVRPWVDLNRLSIPLILTGLEAGGRLVARQDSVEGVCLCVTHMGEKKVKINRIIVVIIKLCYAYDERSLNIYESPISFHKEAGEALQDIMKFKFKKAILTSTGKKCRLQTDCAGT